MQVIYKRCAGLDVHKKTVTACRREGRKRQEIKSFGTTTPELLGLVDWLLEWSCTHVAMESTGDYWKPSFIPPLPQRDLRDLTRYRTKLVQERTRVVNRVQKVLEGANTKLLSVATDIMSMSGRDMLEAMIAGNGDAKSMAQLARGRMRSKIPQLEKALTGLVREHHRFLLSRQLIHIDCWMSR